MERKLLEKDMIFYSPGQKGPAFTIQTGNFVDSNMLKETVSHLEYETERTISYVKDRRLVPRIQ